MLAYGHCFAAYLRTPAYEVPNLVSLSLFSRFLNTFAASDAVYRLPIVEQVLQGDTRYKDLLLDLSDCDNLLDPPSSVCRTPQQLIAYLDDIRRGATLLSHVRVMVVGHGGVGKSTCTKTVLLGQPLWSSGSAACIAVGVVVESLTWHQTSGHGIIPL